MSETRDTEPKMAFETEMDFKALFEAHYSALVRYAVTFLKDGDEAEDTVQQVFVGIWERRQELEVHTSAKALLYRSVYNASLNRIKQWQVRSRYAGEARQHTAIVSLQNELQKKELEQKIEYALTTLPEQCAKIFKMSRFDQLKYQEIANELGLSVKTIENQMGKALKLMREQLKDFLPLLLLLLSQYYHE